MLKVGSRAQVMHGNAKMTGGGLKKKDLKYNKQGRIVSKKMSAMAKKEKRLQKAGYITVKGQFGVIKKMSGGSGKINKIEINRKKWLHEEGKSRIKITSRDLFKNRQNYFSTIFINNMGSLGYGRNFSKKHAGILSHIVRDTDTSNGGKYRLFTFESIPYKNNNKKLLSKLQINRIYLEGINTNLYKYEHRFYFLNFEPKNGSVEEKKDLKYRIKILIYIYSKILNDISTKFYAMGVCKYISSNWCGKNKSEYEKKTLRENYFNTFFSLKEEEKVLFATKVDNLKFLLLRTYDLFLNAIKAFKGSDYLETKIESYTSNCTNFVADVLIFAFQTYDQIFNEDKEININDYLPISTSHNCSPNVLYRQLYNNEHWDKSVYFPRRSETNIESNKN